MAIQTAAPRPTERARLDETVSRVRGQAAAWARAPIHDRILLAESMRAGVGRIAERAVAAACEARSLPRGTAAEGEEWLVSPWVMLRTFRELAESLRAIERTGTTPVGPISHAEDGRPLVELFPASRLDTILFTGARAHALLEEGAAADGEPPRAGFYRQRSHDGKVCLVLGAGNVNSIPPADVATKLFNEGKACILKMNPVNAYLGPLLEEAFADAIARGVLAVVYGAADEGAYLTYHPSIDEVHITGSDRTHDTIVWGPPGPARAERMARGEPLLKKEITSELGNITPAIVVPGPWSDRELAYQAESVAGMVTHNASFNCISGKMLVLPRGWALRDRFLSLVREAMGRAPARYAWYPGADERYRRLTEGRATVERIGAAEGVLPWTIVTGLDPEDRNEVAFELEPFCAILSETSIGSADPLEFLDAAVRFANDRLHGTLAAALVVSGGSQQDPVVAPAVERAIRALRYGTIGVNVWPGMAFALTSLPWGAFPGAPLTDIQSGRGFVHNTRMLDRVEKTILRAPPRGLVKLPYFPGHRSGYLLGRRVERLEESGNWLHLPGVLAAALRG